MHNNPKINQILLIVSPAIVKVTVESVRFIPYNSGVDYGYVALLINNDKLPIKLSDFKLVSKFD